MLLAEKKVELPTCIARIDLERLDPERARRDLDFLGIRRSVIYPDIDNLVRQLKSQGERGGW